MVLLAIGNGGSFETRRHHDLFQNLHRHMCVRYWERDTWIRICVWQGMRGKESENGD